MAVVVIVFISISRAAAVHPMPLILKLVYNFIITWRKTETCLMRVFNLCDWYAWLWYIWAAAQVCLPASILISKSISLLLFYIPFAYFTIRFGTKTWAQHYMKNNKETTTKNLEAWQQSFFFVWKRDKKKRTSRAWISINRLIEWWMHFQSGWQQCN